MDVGVSFPFLALPSLACAGEGIDFRHDKAGVVALGHPSQQPVEELLEGCKGGSVLSWLECAHHKLIELPLEWGLRLNLRGIK